MAISNNNVVENSELVNYFVTNLFNVIAAKVNYTSTNKMQETYIRGGTYETHAYTYGTVNEALANFKYYISLAFPNNATVNRSTINTYLTLALKELVIFKHFKHTHYYIKTLSDNGANERTVWETYRVLEGVAVAKGAAGLADGSGSTISMPSTITDTVLTASSITNLCTLMYSTWNTWWTNHIAPTSLAECHYSCHCHTNCHSRCFTCYKCINGSDACFVCYC